MKLTILDEPELEFAAGARHVDIRFGLMGAGPLDVLNPRTRAISVGLVGTTQTVEGIGRWLDRCRDVILGKESPYHNLFPRFPGFRQDCAFRSSLLLEGRAQRTILQRELTKVTQAPMSNAMIEAAAELFLDDLRYVAEKARPDVLICAPPLEVMEAVKGEPRATDGEDDSGESAATRPDTPMEYDFHDLLKARAMTFHIPVQLVWPHTYDPSKRRRQKRHPNRMRANQDEATRAWNLHTALYYKAGGIPWRLVRDTTQLATCSVGISFYNSLERDRLLTSMAQVFNERGDGVVVRGGQAVISKVDRQPHLLAKDAEMLLTTALAVYRREHKHLPARLVLHKTSRYNEDERAGFLSAADTAGVEQVDFLSLDSSFIRLYREGSHPPLRGSLLSLDDRTHVLYTRGSVDFFSVYPGLYVPVPVLFRCEATEETPRFLAQELFSQTKMNWNSTQFDGRDPITTRAAQQVGAILRYVGATAPIEPGYCYYM